MQIGSVVALWDETTTTSHLDAFRDRAFEAFCRSKKYSLLPMQTWRLFQRWRGGICTRVVFHEARLVPMGNSLFSKGGLESE